MQSHALLLVAPQACYVIRGNVEKVYDLQPRAMLMHKCSLFDGGMILSFFFKQNQYTIAKLFLEHQDCLCSVKTRSWSSFTRLHSILCVRKKRCKLIPRRSYDCELLSGLSTSIWWFVFEIPRMYNLLSDLVIEVPVLGTFIDPKYRYSGG